MKIIYVLIFFCLIISVSNAQDNLVKQKINYTEFVGDIPNPDRGFYRPQSYVVPVHTGLTPSLPDLKATISGTSVSVDSRIIYMEIDLRNFSSNAPLNGIPVGEWGGTQPEYGTTQPLTSAALDYIKNALQQIRESEAVPFQNSAMTDKDILIIIEEDITISFMIVSLGRLRADLGMNQEVEMEEFLKNQIYVESRVMRIKIGCNTIFGKLEMYLVNLKMLS